MPARVRQMEVRQAIRLQLDDCRHVRSCCAADGRRWPACLSPRHEVRSLVTPHVHEQGLCKACAMLGDGAVCQTRGLHRLMNCTAA